ncbi:MAG: hypothetical protein WDN46_23800 [Methylocella sp.]
MSKTTLEPCGIETAVVTVPIIKQPLQGTHAAEYIGGQALSALTTAHRARRMLLAALSLR